ncbi:hypothetical protein C8Q79DRAFT_478725 [Trametes meyenii]|nr:hypothetical protein C8Q79DRAFT_478725 [Trametes meyenii]
MVGVASSVRNFASFPPGSAVDSFRRDFKNELLGRVVYCAPGSDEHAKLMSMLFDGKSGISTNPAKMTTVLNNLLSSRKVKDALKVIRLITEEDSKLREEELYPPLEDLFGAIEIEAAAASDRAYCRKFVNKYNQELVAEDFVFPESPQIRGKPDFVLAEVPPPQHGKIPDMPHAGGIRWRQCCAFFEVKSSREQSPHPAIVKVHTDIKKTLSQGTDYARLILNARPFQLYVYGIFFCGDTWCVGYFDRRGVVLGCGVSLFDSGKVLDEDAFAKFVRVIIRLSWEMSPQQLGHDPTVTLLDGHAYYDQTYPRFLVRVHTTENAKTDVEELRTYGPPLWSSHSLLGRGTSVHRAVHVSKSRPVILKNAWRSASRKHESFYYECIRQFYATPGESVPPGLAQFLVGGDVLEPQTGQWLSVGAFRRGGPFAIDAKDDVGLHRVVLDDYGKSLWQSDNPLQVARAMLMALDAHQSLSEKGLLHRDISAGNILVRQRVVHFSDATTGEDVIITENLSPGEGFLADFELASLRPNAVDPFRISKVEDSFQSLPANDALRTQIFSDSIRQSTLTRKTPGRPITGTAIFAATSLLEAIVEKRSISRISDQDIESFGWVFIYAMYRMAMHDAPSSKSGQNKLVTEFNTLFAPINITDILQGRSAAFKGTNLDKDIQSFPGISALSSYFCDRFHPDDVYTESIEYVWVILFRLQPLEPPRPENPRKKLNAFLRKDPSMTFNPVPMPRLENPGEKLRAALENIITGTDTISSMYMERSVYETYEAL